MKPLFAAIESEAPAAQQSLFAALGVNWKLLIVQGLAFLVLVAVLRKFVYPVLIKSIDSHRSQIEAGLEEAKKSHLELEKAEAKAADLLAEARKDADAVLARSQQEAAVLLQEAEAKAKVRAERLMADAAVKLDAEVNKARRALKHEAAQLVSQATERILHEKLDSKKDAQLIEQSLSEAR